MASVKSMCIAALSLVWCLCGCSPFDDPLWQYRMAQIDRYRAEVRRQYQAEVAAHAAKEQHLGTWVRRDRRPTKTYWVTIQTVALFRDGTYVHKTVDRRGDFLPTSFVDITTGEWQKTAPGRVQLTVTGKWREEPRGKAKLVPPEKPETQTIDLKEWTNTFLEANAALMSEGEMEMGRRPAEQPAE